MCAGCDWSGLVIRAGLGITLSGESGVVTLVLSWRAGIVVVNVGVGCRVIGRLLSFVWTCIVIHLMMGMIMAVIMHIILHIIMA